MSARIPIRSCRTFPLLAVTHHKAFAQDNPAAGVELQLVDDNGKVIGTTKTKKDGSWKFTVPSEGKYKLVMFGVLEPASVAINTKGTGADKGRSAGKDKQTFTATATLSDGTTENRTSGGHETEIEVLDFNLEITSSDASIVSPRDAASGQSSGKRQHSPLKILKRIDKSTPLLYSAKSGGTIAGTMTYDLKKGTK